jgi:hypothetical protein
VITQDNLKELMHYDLNTGVFTWKVATNGYIKKGDIAGEVMKKGYIRICVLKKRYMAHRLAFLYVLGRLPSDQVDHINRVKGDNRWINLRNATSSENSKNKSISSANKTGVTGMEFYSGGRYQSSIRVNRKLIYLGLFTDKFEAICARKSAEVKYGFHENHGKILAKT